MAKKKPSDADLILKTQEMIDFAVEYSSEELESFRQKAARYYRGETPDGLRDRPNRSTYVDTVLRDTILWIQPSLSRVFSSTFDVVELRPRGAFHADQVAASEAWVNQVLTAQNSAFILDTQVMNDALQYRLGFQRVYWAEDNTIRIEVIEPQNVLLSRDATVDRLQWPFCGIKTETNPARLRAEGYDVTDDIDGPELEGFLDIPLEEFKEEKDDDMSLVDPAYKLVHKYELWWPCYETGDWHYCVRVGSEILAYSKVPEHEIIFWTPIIRSHRLDGLSISDLSFKLQDVSTAMHRSLNDNVYRTANPREEVVLGGLTEWTYGDLINDQLDGRIRVRQAGTISPIPPTPMPTSIMELMNHYDDRISARTGVQKYQQGLAPDALNKTAAGTAMIMDAASLRIEQIARTFAETGFRDRVGLILRMTLREPDRLLGHMVSVHGVPVPLDPSMIVDDFDVMVNVGVGVGNRTERMTTLQGQEQFFMNLLANPAAGRLLPGGDLAIFTAQNLYNTRAEILKLAGYTNTHAFLTDPMNPMLPRDQPLPPPPPTPEEQYVEVEKLKVDLAREKSMFEQIEKVSEMSLKAKEKEAAANEKLAQIRNQEQQVALEQERLLVAERRHEMDLELKERELAIQEAEIQLRATEMILKYQAEGVLPIDQMSALSAQLKALEAATQRLAEPAEAKVLRAEDGSILGIERKQGGRTIRRLVERDETGSPVGVREEAVDNPPEE